jgi:hypothetical protein
MIHQRQKSIGLNAHCAKKGLLAGHVNVALNRKLKPFRLLSNTLDNLTRLKTVRQKYSYLE